jgi:hypothetical protein
MTSSYICVTKIIILFEGADDGNTKCVNKLPQQGHVSYVRKIRQAQRNSAPSPARQNCEKLNVLTKKWRAGLGAEFLCASLTKILRLK